jgi:histidyl-tRNA synthetase
MLGCDLFPEELNCSTRVIFLNFGGAEQAASLALLRQLRSAGVPAEIYPDAAKMKKQMEYANRRGIPFVVIIGSDELAAEEATVKNMLTGEQQKVAFAELVAALK